MINFLPFSPLFPNAPPGNQKAACHHAAQQLFSEALCLYLNAMRTANMLRPDDKHLILIAIDGLAALGAYHLARVLIRLSFSDLTADELLDWLDKARRERRLNDVIVPF